MQNSVAGPNVILRIHSDPPTGLIAGSTDAKSCQYEMPAGFENHCAERGSTGAVPSLSW